jgi:hypothetical protein
MIPQINPYLQAYMQAMQQQFNQTPAQSAQMTPPTIHADIIQVGGQDDVERFSVGAGASQMFMARDDSAIYIKTGTPTGAEIVVYERRTGAPPAFVTREELEQRLSALAAKEG